MADDGIPFDGASLTAGPLGGAETAFIGLAEGLAARGHRVDAYTRTGRRIECNGVRWMPIESGLPRTADLYIANRGTAVLDGVKAARAMAFWLHNPARYLLKPRYLTRLWRRRPVVVMLGGVHAASLPGWVPTGGRAIIPLGIDGAFRALPRRAPPPPRAVFVSNPLRRLDWVLERWAADIRPRVPGAELHVFSSLATYGGGLAGKEAEAESVLKRALGLADAGVVLHAPVAKAALADIFQTARVFLHGGDSGETFCLAAAETQAAGVPGVVARLGALAERVRDGETGFVVAPDDAAGFSRHAAALLGDDTLWRRQHEACLATQRGLAWTEVAALWEALLP